jgi:MFS family permease
MKAEGTISRAPLMEAFTRWGNLKIVLLAFVLSSGFGVVWYTSQFYTLVFLTQTLKVSGVTANIVIMLALLFATPFFVLFGWVSDKIGRKKVILTGVALGALAFFPGFHALTHFGNPALERALAASPVVVVADPADCHFQFNLTGTSKFTSPCDIAKAQLVAASVEYSNEAAPGGAASVRIGAASIPAPVVAGLPAAEAVQKTDAFAKELRAAVAKAGYPTGAAAESSPVMLTVIVFLLVFCLAIAYGPVPAFLVELFPARIRYSSLSLPYHLGTGWFGGLVPTIAVAMVAYKGNIYFGLWFPVIVALVAVVICALFLPERRNVDINA